MMMNKYIQISVIIFVAVISLRAQSEIHNVTIQTNNESALIYVDDSLVGAGNSTLTLSGGEHLIKVKLAQREWGTQIIKDTLSISYETGDIVRKYNFEKLYYLDTNPQDVTVYKNKKLVGHTPLFIKNGVEFVSLAKKDYTPQNLKLSEITGHKKVNLDFIGKPPTESFIDSPWFKVLLGTAVALGATAAHYKIQADNQYDQYLDTSDKKYLDQTDKYDLYSGFAFGALQINFGVLIYILLND